MGNRKVLGIAVIGVLTAVAGWAATRDRGYVSTPVREEAPKAKRDEAKLFPVHIRKPEGPLGVDTGSRDGEGKPIVIACNICHTVRPPNLENRDTRDLNEFHQGLQVGHGNLACAACHNPTDGYTTLRLAEGKSLPYSEVMQLCAQCHGPQYRSYLHGSHGGMTGFWDLSKGPRQRNHCIDCHDPHSPKFPVVAPVAKPNDRFPPQVGGHP